MPIDFILNPGQKETPDIRKYYNWDSQKTPRNIRTRNRENISNSDLNLNLNSDQEYEPTVKKKYRKYKC